MAVLLVDVVCRTSNGHAAQAGYSLATSYQTVTIAKGAATVTVMFPRTDALALWPCERAPSTAIIPDWGDIGQKRITLSS